MRGSTQIVVDACVLINLEATDRLESIARATGLKLLVTEPARAETGGLRAEVDGVTRVLPVSLERHVEAGTIAVTALRHEELAMYVALALDLGDGEASSIAVAANRGLAIATDDRKARRVSIECGLSDPMRTTGILRAYCDTVRCDPRVVRELLHLVQQRASFVPPRSDPDLEWWRLHFGL